MAYDIHLIHTITEKNFHKIQFQQPIIAIMGKSNVGKSSLMNQLFQKKMARKGKTPGLTSFIYAYQFTRSNKSSIFLDFPGYGFARGGKQRESSFIRLMQEFLRMHRQQISALLFLLDIRRVLDDGNNISVKDDFWLQYVLSLEIPTLIVLTKSDKVSVNKGQVAKSKIAKLLDINTQDVFLVSSLKKSGIKDLNEFIWDFIL